jgi:6-phosphogluconolactonase (cycloisomerase 2 family)
VAVFTRSADTGMLRFAGRTESGAEGLDGADGLCLSPDGKHLYVAGYTDDAVAAFSCSAGGALTAVGVTPGLEGARDVAVSPDGAHVYAALAGSDSLAVLERDPATGALALLSIMANGSDGVTHMETPTEVEVSADGAQVYVTAYTSDAILWFSRDAATGALTPAGLLQDEVDGVDGLNGAHGLALAPGGDAVLVAAYLDGSVTAFARDPASGALTFASMVADGAGGVAALDNVRDVVVSPSGDRVYASGSGEDAVVGLKLEPATLALSPLQTIAVGDLPRGLALSPDGRSLYVCSSGADALTGMRLSP